MDSSVKTPPITVRSPRSAALWVGLGYLVIAVVLAISSVLRASLSGELNPYEPSATEVATWSWGQGLFFTGVALLVVWSIAVALLHRRLAVTRAQTTALVIGGFAFCVAATVITWFVVLPPLPSA